MQTAPAQIRKVRQGDNPWYEVVIIEGRNRELRKMFEEIGHHVEKIRRVGYGPLVLDLEPGKMRELEPEELEDLRKAADGKLRKPKSKDKRRDASKAQLPTLKPRVGVPPSAVAGSRTPCIPLAPRVSLRKSNLEPVVHRVPQAEISVPGPNVLAPVPPASAHRDPALSDPAPRGPARQVPGHHNLAPTAPRGRKTIAPPVRRLGLRAAHRAPNSVRPSSGRHLRVKIGRLADLREVAVLTALAPSRRSRGRSTTRLARIVQTAQRSNPTPAQVEMLLPPARKLSLQDHPGCI